MPTYGYRCTKCGHEFERFQKISDPPITECEACEAPVKKIIYPVGIAFKGDGFYVNDSKKSTSSAPAAKAAEPTAAPAPTEAKPAAETKPPTTPSTS